MIFNFGVEKWRDTVNAQITRLAGQFSWFKSLQDELKLTLSDTADIILAIIKKESSGNELAEGDNGNSIGLMQLNYGAGTPQSIGYIGTKEQLYDPTKNIYYGTLYFFTRLKHYRNINAAILSYNAGSLILKSGVPINLDYLTSVLSFLEKKNGDLSDFSPLDLLHGSSSKEKDDPKISQPQKSFSPALQAGRDDVTPVTSYDCEIDNDLLSEEKKRITNFMRSAIIWIVAAAIGIIMSFSKIICDGFSRVF